MQPIKVSEHISKYNMHSIYKQKLPVLEMRKSIITL